VIELLLVLLTASKPGAPGVSIAISSLMITSI
jgi:hypothetical protein